MVGLANTNNVPVDNEKSSQLVKQLRTLLKSTVLTPDSEGYSTSIVRWSDAMEKKAVSSRRTAMNEHD
jgi:hypothetical protein